MRTPRSPRALATVLLAVLLLGSAGCTDDGVPATADGEVLPVGDRVEAPAVEGELLGGGTFDPASLDEQVTVLNFWGSWCGPCRLEVPELSALSAELAGDPVTFLGVDLRDVEQPASAFVADHGIGYPSLFDPRGEVALAFADFPVTSTPSTVLLDAEGRVAAVYPGPVAADDLRRALGTLLAED